MNSLGTVLETMSILAEKSWEPFGLDADDVDEVFDAAEIVDVARVKREVSSERSGGDQEVHGARTAGFAPGGCDRRIDMAVSPCGCAVERQWVERGLRSLQMVLTSCSFCTVAGRMRASSQFGHREGADCQFSWELVGVEMIEVNQDRGVDESLWGPSLLSHVV